MGCGAVIVYLLELCVAVVIRYWFGLLPGVYGCLLLAICFVDCCLVLLCCNGRLQVLLIGVLLTTTDVLFGSLRFWCVFVCWLCRFLRLCLCCLVTDVAGCWIVVSAFGILFEGLCWFVYYIRC